MCLQLQDMWKDDVHLRRDFKIWRWIRWSLGSPLRILPQPQTKIQTFNKLLVLRIWHRLDTFTHIYILHKYESLKKERSVLSRKKDQFFKKSCGIFQIFLDANNLTWRTHVRRGDHLRNLQTCLFKFRVPISGPVSSFNKFSPDYPRAWTITTIIFPCLKTLKLSTEFQMFCIYLWKEKLLTSLSMNFDWICEIQLIVNVFFSTDWPLLDHQKTIPSIIFTSIFLQGVIFINKNITVSHMRK